MHYALSVILPQRWRKASYTSYSHQPIVEMPTIDRKTQPQRSCNQVMHMMNIAIVNERTLVGDLEWEKKSEKIMNHYFASMQLFIVIHCINWNPSRVRIFLTNNITTSRQALTYSIFVSTSNHRQQSESYLVINLIYSSTSCTDRIALAVITYQRKTIFSATATKRRVRG